MFFLWALFAFVGLTSGETSILDTFGEVEDSVCEQNTGTRYGKAQGEEQGCALMCLLHDNCTSISLTAHATEPCRVIDVCVAGSEAGTTYTRTNDTDSSSWVQLEYPASGMERFDRQISYEPDYGLMFGMTEDVCVLHCLLTDCPAVTWMIDGRCAYKTASAGTALANYPQVELYTHVRTVIAGCMASIHGYSCYALLTYQNGQTKQTALEQCQKVGGNLVEFNSHEERDAVIADGRFNVVWGPLWLGITYTSGQWKGESSDTVYNDLHWADNHPASTNEGQAVFVDPRNDWLVHTSPDNNPKTNPFCELTSGITMMTSGSMTPTLNDGNVTTCVASERPAVVAGTILKTINLSPAPATSFLVKVHGDGLICKKKRKNNNIQIWQELKKKKSNYNNGSGWGSHMAACPLIGSYIWHEKPLCLYKCLCDDTHDCGSAYLRMGYSSNITICELQVL